MFQPSDPSMSFEELLALPRVQQHLWLKVRMISTPPRSSEAEEKVGTPHFAPL